MDRSVHHDERPWGSFDRFTLNEPSTVKLIRILPERRLSLQRHEKREEYWRVVRGTGTAEVNGTAHELAPGSEIMVPTGATHRLAAGPDGLDILEIAFGEFDEDDIERLADDYGRDAESSG